MICGLVPAVIGFVILGQYTAHAGHLWLKWGMFLLTVMANLAGVMIWTFLPTNVAGRTKKVSLTGNVQKAGCGLNHPLCIRQTVVSTLIFIAYCAVSRIRTPTCFLSAEMALQL
jgi:hypothetical protein